MRILLAAPHFPPRYVGGVEVYTQRLANQLVALGHHVEVVCVEHLTDDAHTVDVVIDESLGYPVHRLTVGRSRETRSLESTYGHPLIERRIAQVIMSVRPDVVHLQSGYLLGVTVLAAARAQAVPAVVTLHDFWFICPRITMLHPSGTCCTGPDSAAKCAWCLSTERRRYRVPDALTGGALGRLMTSRHIGRMLRSITGVSSAAEDVTRRQSVLLSELEQAAVILSQRCFVRDQVAKAGVNASRIKVLRLGVDPIAKTSRERQAGSIPLRVAFLGQIAPHKGVHVFVDAIRQLDGLSIEARIYGDPSRVPAYTDSLRVRAGGDPRIVFAGPYRHEHIGEVLEWCDAIVVPSVWHETGPLVMLEAHTSRVPVIASRLGGMAETIEHDVTGLLFTPGDAPDLARQLRRLTEEDGLLARLSASIPDVKTADAEVSELVAIYREIIKNVHAHVSPS
jgi:glycosyltransferase involved in cell wall biosynthesis